MAVEITLTFTDAQWELVKKHYRPLNEIGLEAVLETPEQLQKRLMLIIKKVVEQAVEREESRAFKPTKNTFEI